MVRGKIRLQKVEHPEFEGHVMLNKDGYKKICQVIIQIMSCSIIITISLLITCTAMEEIDFVIGHFLNKLQNFWTSVTLTLDWVITIMQHSSTSTFVPNFVAIGNNFMWLDIGTLICTYGL